ncbi:MAG: mechanosensitive ion channel [Pseudomonadales bacterium]
MNELTSRLNDFLGPVASSALGHAVIGLLILIVGLLIVRIIAGMLTRLLNRVDFLNTANLSKPISSLIRAVLTIFVLIAVLEHFGLTDVLQPLSNMVDQFLAAVPRIIGAGVVGYAGWVIAKIVSDLVGAGLNKADEQLALRTGSDDIKVSRFGSAFVFGAILLPIAVAALGVLNIPAISVPASDMINRLMSAVPNIVGAGIILLVTYFVAKFVVFMLTGLLEGMNFNALPEKLGAQGLFSASFTPVKLVSGAVMFFAMLTASVAAVNTLGISVISDVFAKVLQFGGGLLVGGVILIIGNFLGTLAHQKLTSSGNAGLANIAKIAILGLVLAMGLRSMGLADNIVNMAFGFTIGAVAVAVAIAFGLGGRDAAKKVADDWATRVNR